MVSIEELKRVCQKYNLIFIGTTDFSKWYNIFNDDILKNEEKEFSFLNFSFIFQKK